MKPKILKRDLEGGEALQALATIPAPAPMGRYHRPLRHQEIFLRTVQVLTETGFNPLLSQVRVTLLGNSEDGPDLDMFAVLPVGGHRSPIPGAEEAVLEVGIRHSNRQKFAVQITAGYRLVVCSNGVMTGENLVRRKHTTRTRWEWVIRDGIARIPSYTGEIDDALRTLWEVPLSFRGGEPHRLEVDALSWRALQAQVPGQVIRAAREVLVMRDLPELRETGSTLLGWHQALTRAIAERSQERRLPADETFRLESRAWRHARDEAALWRVAG